MKIKYSDIFLNVNKPKDYNSNLPNIILLHGFTGSSDDWDEIINEIDNGFNKITIDLIGHGKSDFPNDPALYSWELQVEQLNKIINYFTEDKVVLMGYSMGGRLSLCYAYTYPERVSGLILESASPGIKGKKQREKRIVEDKDLAKFISTHPVEEFIDMWVEKEIFGTQRRFSEAKRKEIKKSKAKGNPVGLSNSLSEFSTGMMPYLYNQFKNIPVPTILITGELDTKFTTLNREVVKKFPSAKHKIIKNAGHTIHLEEPQKFIDATNSFLKELSE